MDCKNFSEEQISGLRDNLADKFARPIINQDCGGRGEEWNKSWELPDNHRLTLSINFVISKGYYPRHVWF